MDTARLIERLSEVTVLLEDIRETQNVAHTALEKFHEDTGEVADIEGDIYGAENKTEEALGWIKDIVESLERKTAPSKTKKLAFGK